MSANTILLDFSVDPAILQDSKESGDIEQAVVNEIQGKLAGPLVNILQRKEISGNSGGSLSIFEGPRSSVISLRIFPTQGLVTVNIEYYLDAGAEPLISLEDCRALEMAWSRGKKSNKTLPALKRGIPFDIYFYSSDERLLEYDIDRVVYDEKSQFQHIQILHSKNFGNLLVLDDLQNLAESDLIYTESIMCRGVENYEGKEILILGGGDGALLYELRKEKPKNVIMIEIDELVIQACKIHLRSCCGDTLDNYKGDNYEIIVGDCVEYMEKCLTNGKKFDYVFADLTDIPISNTPQGEMWDFVKKILNLSFDILKDDGKYLTHGNGSSSPKALKMFENVLLELKVPVEFKTTNAFVPSFLEDWVFYQIQRKH